MEIKWNENHGKLLTSLLNKLNDCSIKYFILRNYADLPENNPSKDVDIIFEPGKMKQVREKIIDTFKEHNMQYYKEELYGHVHSFWAINLGEEFSIHIDLIEGYYAKGYSVFTFDELYKHTIRYKSFYVLDELYSGLMIYIYKQFGYKKPKLKEEYKREIFDVYKKYDKEFERVIANITTYQYAKKNCEYINHMDFDSILKNAKEFNRLLRKYTWKKRPVTTFRFVMEYNFQRLDRIVFRYRKYSNNFAVLAPDGTGKTTFLDLLIDKLNYYRVCRMEDNHISVYHFRPNILPNLGAVGEKAGIKKQDTNFTDPHRNKPAGKLSSFIRMLYYIFDYIIGWQIRVRKDTKQNKWTIFDRYSYDLIVDPLRTRLSLPDSFRIFWVGLTPKPKIVFCLSTDAQTIYNRKQELELSEIQRQLEKYKEIAERDNKRFFVLDASKTPDEISNDALVILYDKYMKKI